MNMHHLSDEEIIQGCMARKQKYQELLYTRYSGKMFAVCLRYAPDYHSAEDILQEGFIKIFKNIDRFRNDGAFEGWLRRIFVNTAIEHFRRNMPLYPIVETPDNSMTIIDEHAFSNLAAEDLMSMLQNLSAGYRTVFNLYVIEGYSHKEIATMLNISEGTSKSQLARARVLLQKIVEATFKNTEENYV